jgi:adenosylcobyric acid synthase
VSVADGAVSPDGRIFGAYLHGLFDNDNLRRAWLNSLGGAASAANFRDLQDQAFDRLADAAQAALDLERLDAILEAQG